MKQIPSKQIGVHFIYCADPITIDKRLAWGNDENNLQIGLNGAFLKMKDETTVSHLVQPNADKSAPVGWMKSAGIGYDKLPIWVSEEVIPANTKFQLTTLDGLMVYSFDEDAVLCYNSQENGDADYADAWPQKISEVKKNYFYE